MSLAFIPLYIKYLGIESYGLIGIFAILQSWLALLDMGMKPALGREMARFSAGAHDAQSIRNLLRTVETIAFSIGALIALCVWLTSGWLALHWVGSTRLPHTVVARSLSAMGFVTALRFVEDVYMSCIVGLQRQVLQNSITSIMSTVRGLGAVALLAWLSPTLKAYFLWQGCISLINVTVFATVVYQSLPAPSRRPRFSRSALAGTWRFAAGMMAITLLSLLLTQVDKVLLSKLLSLEAFGYYALAGIIANSLYSLTSPITGAFYPRFTQLYAAGQEGALISLYHRAAQVVAVLTGSAAVVLILFSSLVLRLWTGNPTLAQKVGPLVSVLAGGALLNCLMWIPYQMMLAHGWTSLSAKINIVAVCIFVPAVLWSVPLYGPLGAAWVWVGLNAGYVLFEIPLMHQRILRGEKFRWFREDTLTPIVAAFIMALVCRSTLKVPTGRIPAATELVAIALAVILAATMSASRLRTEIVRQAPRVRDSLFART